jgi:hypothetical protein
MAAAKIEPDELPKVIRALEHYEAYLRSQRRDDGEFRRIVERLRKAQ